MTDKPPVLFIHGRWLHAMSWAGWLDLFGANGYDASAPGWPGEPETVEEARHNPSALADKGIDDVTDHYAAIIAGLSPRPILIGHSFGGLIAQRLLGLGLGIAAVAVDNAQIKGVLPLPLSALQSSLPVLRNPANKYRAVSLTTVHSRFSFGNAITEEDSAALYHHWTTPARGRRLFEAVTANFTLHSLAAVNTENDERGPLLLITGGKDHTVPESITKSTLRQYRRSDAETDLFELVDRGHSITIDSGWREVAEATLEWLANRGL